MDALERDPNPSEQGLGWVGPGEGGAGLVGLVWAWPSRGVARKDREAVGVAWRGLARAWPHVGGARRGGAWRGRGLHKLTVWSLASDLHKACSSNLRCFGVPPSQPQFPWL
jgi:hypothetical protein